MSNATEAILLGVCLLASCIWVSGYVAIAVVARTAVRTLSAPQRVAFFRSLGRSDLRVGAPALAIALGTGAALLSGHPWDATMTATSAAAAGAGGQRRRRRGRTPGG